MPEQEVNVVEKAASENFDSHLEHLLTPATLEKPWFLTFFTTVKEAIHPPKLPPLEVTSKPVEVEEMWGWYHGNETKSGLYSLLIHVSVVALLFWIGSRKTVQQFAKERIVLFAPDLKPYIANTAKDQAHGGGGGGTKSPLDASKGKLPKIAPRQFTPPEVVTPPDPKLPMTPTIVAQADIPNINAPDLGDPLSKLGVPSERHRAWRWNRNRHGRRGRTRPRTGRWSGFGRRVWRRGVPDRRRGLASFGSAQGRA